VRLTDEPCAYVPQTQVSPSLRFIQEHIKSLLQQIGDAFKVVYFIFDGEPGHNDALQMVRQVGLHLVSKLRYNSALYFPYAGPYCGRGPRHKYGKKLDYRNMPSAYLVAGAKFGRATATLVERQRVRTSMIVSWISDS